MAMRKFQEAVEDNLPASLRAIAERQLVEVQNVHQHLRSLDHAQSRMA